MTLNEMTYRRGRCLRILEDEVQEIKGGSHMVLPTDGVRRQSQV